MPVLRLAEAMKRIGRNDHFPYEQEHIGGDLCAVRVFLEGCTYRVSTPGNAHTTRFDSAGPARVPEEGPDAADGRAVARRAPPPRLALPRSMSRLYRSKPMLTLWRVTGTAERERR